MRDLVYLLILEEMPAEIEIMSLGLDAEEKQVAMDDIEFFSKN